jgi:hypothetical protein
MKVLMAVILVLLSSFHRSWTQEPGIPLHAQQIPELTGAWEFRISFDDAAKNVSGVIALIPDSTRQYFWVQLEDANYFGVYSADLQTDALTGGSTCPYRMVAARITDSTVVIVLNPSQDHGAIRLTGRLRGSLIGGDAVESAYGTGRSGTFTMRLRPQ